MGIIWITKVSQNQLSSGVQGPTSERLLSKKRFKGEGVVTELVSWLANLFNVLCKTDSVSIVSSKIALRLTRIANSRAFINIPKYTANQKWCYIPPVFRIGDHFIVSGIRVSNRSIAIVGIFIS